MSATGSVGRSLLAGLALILPIMQVGAALPEWCNGGATTIIVGESIAPVAYITIDRFLTNIGPNPLMMWVYAESNGEPGLQRGGGPLLMSWKLDACQESPTPDTAVAFVFWPV